MRMRMNTARGSSISLKLSPNNVLALKQIHQFSEICTYENKALVTIAPELKISVSKIK